MSSESEQQMNVARPGAYARVVLSLCLLFCVALCLAVILPTEEPGEGMTVHEDVLMIVVWLGFTCLSAWIFAVVWTVYRWNEQEIRASCFGRERCVRWDDIATLHVKRVLGNLRYILTDASGGRLTVDVQLLGADSPLHVVLRRRLAHFARQELDKIDVSGEARFTMGSRGHRLILRRTSLVSKLGFRRREISFSEIATVYQGEKGGTVLVSRTGKCVGIPLTTHGYDPILAYIRDRARNAIWVDMDQPEPAGGAEKTAYRQRVIHQERIQMCAGLFVTAILVAFVSVPCLLVWPLLRSLRDMPGERHWWVKALVCIYLIGAAFVYLLARAIQQAVRWRRSMRELTGRSNAFLEGRDSGDEVPLDSRTSDE
jgi:hypothetical protein